MAIAPEAIVDDRSAAVLERFDRRLREQLRALITDDLIEEHRRNPLGHHSDALQRVLHYFRRAPLHGKYALICTRPHEQWQAVRLTGERGPGAPEPIDGALYSSIEEAEHAVFLLRVRDLQHDD